FQAFDKAVEVEATNATAWMNRGMALEMLERYEDAVTSFDKAIEFNPTPKAWDKRGYVLIELEKDEEALRSFEKALELDPNYASAFYNRAISYSYQAKVDEAIEDLKKAIELNEKYKEDAVNDPDFEGVAEDDKFKELVN
ncbi:MAG: tetratricopeptide repeat protein, partial [Cyanobacteria bacterium J06643_5]